MFLILFFFFLFHFGTGLPLSIGNTVSISEVVLILCNFSIYLRCLGFLWRLDNGKSGGYYPLPSCHRSGLTPDVTDLRDFRSCGEAKRAAAATSLLSSIIVRIVVVLGLFWEAPLA